MTIVPQPVSGAAPPSLTGGQRSRCEPAAAASNRLQIGKLHSSMLMSSIELHFDLFGSGFAGLRGSPVINRRRSAWPHAAIRFTAGSKDTNLEIKTKQGFSSVFSQNEKCTGKIWAAFQRMPLYFFSFFRPDPALAGKGKPLNFQFRILSPLFEALRLVFYSQPDLVAGGICLQKASAARIRPQCYSISTKALRMPSR